VGNPGIGKSWFLFYTLKRLADNGAKTIVYQNRKITDWYALHCEKIPFFLLLVFVISLTFPLIIIYRYVFRSDGTVQRGQKEIPSELLDDTDTWYLVDTKEPNNCKAKVIMVSSPCREHYKDYQKRRTTLTRFMPVWSFDELKVARKVKCMFFLSRAT